MGKHHLRKNNTCENCGHLVEQRFCSYCGQENVETRQSFGHLAKHFTEDLTHYESNFWKTIKYLLFRPGYLTRTYLAGKRVSYVAPVKLYIFISFLAFFIPAILPHVNTSKDQGSIKVLGQELEELSDEEERLDSTGREHGAPVNDSVIKAEKALEEYYASAHAYDSIQRSLPEAERDNFIVRYIHRKVSADHGMTQKEMNQKIGEAIVHNLPKGLFMYMPVFAFFLWLFHSKKKWFYFDHAIFTLHYLSFILLLITLAQIVYHLIPWYFIIPPAVLSVLFSLICWLWATFYFYRSHRRVYEEKRIVSRFKATVILFFNWIAFFLVFILFILLVMVTAVH